ncbi:MAG: 16S rRNA (adenine(1518)-N(6)/adenine(1519)-N(6))-dimethyltransferase RsmA [Deltaproteobacteria bacterium]|nr:16S rRNA (adenine(1518)-N(6)/adenine(1519)-N(6))-dimethyltransferase RsmA [Deltaproteobacteria bacterium]
MASGTSSEEGRPFRPKKRLGQNFLVDPTISEKIVSLSGFSSEDTVLEIGPGKGALTVPLAERVKHVLAVEKDARLVDWLTDRLKKAGLNNVTLLHEDILKLDWESLREHFEAEIPVIGNLPYNISSPILEKMCQNPQWMARAVLMFQKEVAQRLTAMPGNKAYGALTLLVQYHAKVFSLLKVQKGSFFPVPKVDSVVICLDFETPYPQRAVHEAFFRKVVKGAFAHRRKTISNSLKGAMPDQAPESILNALAACGIDSGKRAEVLEMGDFLRLSVELAIDSRIIE